MVHLKTFDEALTEAIQNKENEKIVNVKQAVEIIADKLKQIGLRATKLKNYGYYSFAVKDTGYKNSLKTAFADDPRFKLVEKNSYLEYTIEVKELQVNFSLKYESTKQNSKLVLSLNLDD